VNISSSSLFQSIRKIVRKARVSMSALIRRTRPTLASALVSALSAVAIPLSQSQLVVAAAAAATTTAAAAAAVLRRQVARDSARNAAVRVLVVQSFALNAAKRTSEHMDLANGPHNQQTMIRRICSAASRQHHHQSQWFILASSSSLAAHSRRHVASKASDTSKPPRATPKKGKANVNINDVIAANISNSFDSNTSSAPATASSSSSAGGDAEFDMAMLRNRRDIMDSDIALDGDTVAKFLRERRLEDVLVVDVSRKCSWTNSMVFATGKSERQMVAAANALVKEYREIIPTCAEDRKIMEADEHWVALDCGLVVVHLFTAHGRALYKLDQTWINRPDLNEAGLLAEGDDANLSAQDDYEDDPATEAAIAAAAEEARLDPATFGMVGSAVESRAHVVVQKPVAAQKEVEVVEGTVVPGRQAARPERKLIRGVLARRMAANGVWPPTRSVSVSSDD
jgi:ribosome-associated protein